MSVEFGVLLPTREAIMSGRPETGPLLAMAERAEAAGFDSVWIGDSITARPRHEPLTLLAAVAARTRRVRLGTGVLLPALRSPVVLAHVVGTLDRVAEGRVILGVGFAGDAPAIRKEFAAVGVPFERRVGRFLETLEICRALWTRDHVSFSGKHFTLEDATVEPKPHRPGGPPGCCAFGSTVASSIVKCLPLKLTWSRLHSARQISMVSSTRPTRRSNGTPTAANSLRMAGPSVAMPMPRITRPSERRSRVPTMWASTTGWRSAGSSTAVPSFTRRVRAATAASSVRGS